MGYPAASHRIEPEERPVAEPEKVGSEDVPVGGGRAVAAARAPYVASRLGRYAVPITIGSSQVFEPESGCEAQVLGRRASGGIR